MQYKKRKGYMDFHKHIRTKYGKKIFFYYTLLKAATYNKLGGSPALIHKANKRIIS